MTELRTDLPFGHDLIVPPEIEASLPRGDTPIVPKRSIAGRALVAVVSIMTFLASLTTGAVMLVRSSAIEWQSAVAREVTIQVRPAQGRDLDAEVNRAVGIARAIPGVGEVRAYTKAESTRLLEPWLGGGLSLDDLPVPRMIVVKLPSGGADLAPLKRELAEKVAGASLEDGLLHLELKRELPESKKARTIAIANGQKAVVDGTVN
jgi:cell division transport system permease protein